MISETEMEVRDRLRQSRMNDLLQRNEARNRRLKTRMREISKVNNDNNNNNNHESLKKPTPFMAASALLSNLRQHQEKEQEDVKDQEKTIDFYLSSMKLLESLVKDDKTRAHITKFLSVALASPKETERFLQTERIVRKFQHQHMRIITWPSVVEGIMHQFNIDIPRCSFFYKDRIWDNPKMLFDELKWDFGPIWSRWICLFSNQAPLADVLKKVEEKAKESIVSLKERDFVVMELNSEILGQFSEYKLDVEKAKNAVYTLSQPQSLPIVLRIEKNLMITTTSCFEKITSQPMVNYDKNVWICHTIFTVQFLPDLKIEININFL